MMNRYGFKNEVTDNKNNIERILIQYNDGLVEHLSGDRIINRLEEVISTMKKSTEVDVVNFLNNEDRKRITKVN